MDRYGIDNPNMLPAVAPSTKEQFEAWGGRTWVYPRKKGGMMHWILKEKKAGVGVKCRDCGVILPDTTDYCPHH